MSDDGIADEEQPEGIVIATVRCPHGRMFIMRDFCPDSLAEARGREPTWRERRRLRKGLRKLLSE